MGAYYYASGRKVQLEKDEEHVAIDQKAAEKAGLDAQVRAASEGMPRQGGGIILAQRSALGEETMVSLRSAGALKPVYRRAAAVIVALPEIRVEFDTPEQRRAVMDVLAEDHAFPHKISESSGDRLIVSPTSGDGEDALKLANEIYERARPASASVRFIQFVPKPTVRS